MGALPGIDPGSQDRRSRRAQLAIPGVRASAVEWPDGQLRAVKEDVLGPSTKQRVVYPDECAQELR